VFIEILNLCRAVGGLKDYLSVLANATTKFSGGVSLALTAVPNIYNHESGPEILVFGYVDVPFVLPLLFLITFLLFLVLLARKIDFLNRAQSDMPDGLHNLKLFAEMFPEPYQALVNSLALYAKWLICTCSVLYSHLIPGSFSPLAPEKIQERLQLARAAATSGVGPAPPDHDHTEVTPGCEPELALLRDDASLTHLWGDVEDVLKPFSTAVKPSHGVQDPQFIGLQNTGERDGKMYMAIPPPLPPTPPLPPRPHADLKVLEDGTLYFQEIETPQTVPSPGTRPLRELPMKKPAMSQPIFTPPPALTIPPIVTPTVTTLFDAALPVMTPPITISTLTTPPVVAPPVTTPPVTTSPVVASAAPPVMTPPITIPTLTTPPVVAPVVTTPPAVASAISIPPVSAPSITILPVLKPTFAKSPIATPAVVTPYITVPTFTTPPIVAPTVTIPPVAAPVTFLSGGKPTVTMPPFPVPIFMKPPIAAPAAIAITAVDTADTTYPFVTAAPEGVVDGKEDPKEEDSATSNSSGNRQAGGKRGGKRGSRGGRGGGRKAVPKRPLVDSDAAPDPVPAAKRSRTITKEPENLADAPKRPKTFDEQVADISESGATRVCRVKIRT
jgi:hypothetical protein